MPCQGGSSYYDNSAEYIRKIDKLTQKLCYLCASLYSVDLLEKYANPEIMVWHRKHMHKDEVRVQGKMEAIFIKNPKQIKKYKEVAEMFYQKALKVHPVSEFHRKWFYSSAKDIAEKVQNVVHTKNQLKKDKMKALSKLTPEEKELLELAGDGE